MKNKRTIITILLCIVLAMSIFTLAACDDNDNNTNDDVDAPFFIDITKEQFETAFDNVLGYVLSSVTNNENMSLGMTCLIGNLSFLNDNVDEELQYLNCIGFINITDTDRVIHTENGSSRYYILAQLIYYNSEDNALAALPFWEKYIENENEFNYVKQDGKVICISEENVFETIKHSTIPKERNNESVNFIYNILLKELCNDENLYIILPDSRIQKNCIVIAEFYNVSKKSSQEEIWYGITDSMDTVSINDEIKSGYYTNDSYCKIVEINGIEYVEYYLHENENAE